MTPLLLNATQIGFLTPPVLAALNGQSNLPDAKALAEAEHRLREAGLFRPRGERFDVRATPGGPSLATMDRAALPLLGLLAEGVHVNGYVRQQNGALALWVATRALTKPLDPGLLDHIVAGGICAGMDAPTTLIKEAWEEAGIPAPLARTAVPAPPIQYTLQRPEGLRRDYLHCFDLELPADFTPIARDGEVAAFNLLPATTVSAALMDNPEQFKFNVIPVVRAFLARHQILDP